MGSDAEGYKGYSVVSLPSQLIRDKRQETSSGLLEDVASYVIVFTHSCAEKMTSLPFPVGIIIEAVEELAAPLAHSVEGFTLRMLAAVDDQIIAVGTSIGGCLLCLRTRGLVGMSADLWVQYEASVREKLQSLIDLADTIPVIGLMTPFICAMLATLGNAVSDWLLEHSQSHVKIIQLHDNEIEEGKGGLDELRKKASDWSPRSLDMEEAKDVKEEEIKLADATLRMADVGQAAAEEAENGSQEHRAYNMTQFDDKKNDAKDVSAVLELIDSGWLMGSTGVIAPKASATVVHKIAATPLKTSARITPATAAPKASSTPKMPASSKLRRGIPRH